MKTEYLASFARDLVGHPIEVSLDCPDEFLGMADGRKLRMSPALFNGGHSWREAADVYWHELAHLLLGHGRQANRTSYKRQEREACDLGEQMYKAAGAGWFMAAAQGRASLQQTTKAATAIRRILPKEVRLRVLDNENEELKRREDELEQLRGNLPPAEYERRVKHLNRDIRLFSLGG